MDSFISQVNYLFNLYYIIIASAFWVASSLASSAIVRFLFFIVKALIFYWAEIDLRLLIKVTAEKSVINLTLVGGTIRILKSS